MFCVLHNVGLLYFLINHLMQHYFTTQPPPPFSSRFLSFYYIIDWTYNSLFSSQHFKYYIHFSQFLYVCWKRHIKFRHIFSRFWFDQMNNQSIIQLHRLSKIRNAFCLSCSCFTSPNLLWRYLRNNLFHFLLIHFFSWFDFIWNNFRYCFIWFCYSFYSDWIWRMVFTDLSYIHTKKNQFCQSLSTSPSNQNRTKLNRTEIKSNRNLSSTHLHIIISLPKTHNNKQTKPINIVIFSLCLSFCVCFSQQKNKQITRMTTLFSAFLLIIFITYIYIHLTVMLFLLERTCWL